VSGTVNAWYAVMLFETFATAVCASCAVACWRALRRASSRASTTSIRAELDEIRDAFEKNSALLKRINQRTVMQERRAAGNGATDGPSGESVTEWKQRMRRELITPGKPVRHG
jgi:hypothetical protein